MEVEANQQPPLEVVKDEAFPKAVGIATTDPARVDPDQDYFAVRGERKRRVSWCVFLLTVRRLCSIYDIVHADESGL